MKIKPLVVKMTHTELTDILEKQGWRLPTFEELRGCGRPGWIEGDVTEYDAPYYNSKGEVEHINRHSFRLPCTVVKVPCTFTRTPHGFTTECGMRLHECSSFKYCPYCGKRISYANV